MTCKCIEMVEEAYREGDFKGEKIIPESLRINCGLLFDPKVVDKSRPVMEMNYKKEGIKKEYTMNIIPTFCPFCGVKYK